MNKPRLLYPEVAECLPPGLMMRALRFVLPDRERGAIDRDERAVELFDVAEKMSMAGRFRLPAPAVWVERTIIDTNGDRQQLGNLIVAKKDRPDTDVSFTQYMRLGTSPPVFRPYATEYTLDCPPLVCRKARPEDAAKDGAIMVSAVIDPPPGVNATDRDWVTQVALDWSIISELLIALNAVPEILSRPPTQPAAARDGYGRKLLPVFGIGPTIIADAVRARGHRDRDPDHVPTPTGRVVSQHDVRGFTRHYKNGRTTWVRPHKRGNPDVGIRLRTYYDVRRQPPGVPSPHPGAP